MAHDVGQALVFHQDADALEDGGDLLRPLGLKPGEDIELGGLVRVPPPDLQALPDLRGVADVVEGEDVVPVVLHPGQAAGLLLRHQAHVQPLAELEPAAGLLQLVDDLLPPGEAEELVVPQIDVLPGGVKELLDGRVAEHVVVLLVDAEGALAEAAPGGEADAVVHVVAVGLGLDAPGDLLAHVLVIQVVVGHMVLDLVGEILGVHPEIAGAADVQVGIVLGINGHLGKVKHPGEVDLVVSGNGEVVLQQGDVVSQLLLIAADLHQGQVWVAGSVVQQIRVDNADFFAHGFTVLTEEYSKAPPRCQDPISGDHFQNDPRRSGGNRGDRRAKKFRGGRFACNPAGTGL